MNLKLLSILCGFFSLISCAKEPKSNATYFADATAVNAAVITNTINVKNFGAKGDGVTDDTEPIRNAFNAANNAGSIIYFPEGVYVIDPNPTQSMFLLKSNMTVYGDYKRSVLKIKSNSMQLQPAGRPTLCEQMLLGGENITNVTIRYLIFDGNHRGNRQNILDSPTETQAVLLHSVNQVTVEQCSFINIGQAALVFVKCQNSMIKRNYFFDIAQGQVSADAIQINGSYKTQIVYNFLENVQEGIFCQHHNPTQTEDRESTVIFNEIRTLEAGMFSNIRNWIQPIAIVKMNIESLLNGMPAGRAVGPAIGILSRNSKVYNNRIWKHTGIIVSAAQGQGNLSTDSIEVAHNEILHNGKIPYLNFKTGTMDYSMNAAVNISAIRQQVNHIIVQNNRISDANRAGITLFLNPEAGIATISKVDILNNQLIRVCKKGDDRLTGAIRFQNVGQLPANQFKEVRIQGNRLVYQTGAGLWMEPCMKNVAVIQNEYIGASTSFGKINFASGSCLQKIDDLGDFSQADINCLLVPQGICVGCVANPTACVENRKCITCN